MNYSTSPGHNQIAAQAVANEMASERQSMSVSFPVTGDAEITALSGIKSIIRELGLPPGSIKRLAQYFLDLSQELIKSQEQLARMQMPGYPQERTSPWAEDNLKYPSVTTSSGPLYRDDGTQRRPITQEEFKAQIDNLRAIKP